MSNLYREKPGAKLEARFLSKLGTSCAKCFGFRQMGQKDRRGAAEGLAAAMATTGAMTGMASNVMGLSPPPDAFPKNNRMKMKKKVQV